MEVYVGGRKIRADPKNAIGKGGEADIFDVGGGTALKVFKRPDHPDYVGFPAEQQGARERIATHQRKLRQFPSYLPDRVVMPVELATDKSGREILGYTMPLVQGAEVLLRYAERGFREGKVSQGTVLEVFKDLYGTVEGIHQASVVIGDFNDLNVLVDGVHAHVIDTDSFQFGNFPCRMFTTKFVDPTLCDPRATSAVLAKPHTMTSDWYAYAVMLMECLLYVDPYGGVYRPSNPQARIPHDCRPLHRITVFHKDVRYPKPAIPYGVLPDELLHYFHEVFEKDGRGVFPRVLLDGMRWTTCVHCKTEHARGLCPMCATVAPAAVKAVIRVRGKVTSTRIFRTAGVILTATVQEGALTWLVHEHGAWKREDDSEVMHGALDPAMRYRIAGKKTLFAKGSRVATLIPNETPETLAVDTCGGVPLVETAGDRRFWIDHGRFMRDGTLGPEYIGDVLPGQTRFWVGPTFGFGFYRAGELTRAFVFDANHGSLNDSVQLPIIRGQLIDATCVFGGDRAWFATSTHEGGKNINRCALIRKDGTVEAVAETLAGDGSWLGTIHGKCAAGNFLLAATDDGIVRVEANGNTIVKTKEFPDTEPFVDGGCSLFVTKDGLAVVDRQEIRVLKIE